MKKKWTILFVCSIVLILLTACQSAGELSRIAIQEAYSPAEEIANDTTQIPETLEEVQSLPTKDSKILSIEIWPQNFPYQYLTEDGELAGFEIELAYAIGEKLEKEVQFVKRDALWDMLNVMTYSTDATICVDTTVLFQEAVSWLEYSEPFYTDIPCLIVRSDSEITEPTQLTDKKTSSVVYSRGHYWSSFMIDTDAEECDTPEEALSMLRNGEVDAYAADVSYLPSIEEKYPGEFKVLEGIDFSECIEDYCIYLNPKSDLKNQINLALEELKEEGVLDRLIKDHFVVH